MDRPTAMNAGMNIVKERYRLAVRTGCGFTSNFNESRPTKHVIIKTDDELVCTRTFKYFQGIASKIWVVSFNSDDECDAMAVGSFSQDTATADDESSGEITIEENNEDMPIGPSLTSAVDTHIKKSHGDYSTRQPWTVQEKAAAVKYFKNHLRSGVTPSKTQVEEAQNMFPILAQRSWSCIKDFVVAERRRQIKKQQK